MQASSYSDYKSKQGNINAKFAPFFKLPKVTFALDDWRKKLKLLPVTYGDSSTAILENEKYHYKVLSVSADIKKNAPLSISDKLDLQAGIFGRLSISWGNIQAGAAVGIYATGETGTTLSKSFLSANISGSSSASALRKTATALPVPVKLKLFDSPPITIGVIYIRVSFNGYLDIPLDVYFSGDLVTSMYAGFTALYAAGFDFVFNYGIKTKKILGIPIPVGVYADGHFDGVSIDDVAYYAGVIGDMSCDVSVQNANVGFILRPSISFGPELMICDVIGGGVSLGVAMEVGAEAGVRPYKNVLAPYADIIHGVGLDANVRYDVNIEIPLIIPHGIHGKIPIRLTGIQEKRYTLFPK
jgi:hypothetical protein